MQVIFSVCQDFEPLSGCLNFFMVFTFLVSSYMIPVYIINHIVRLFVPKNKYPLDNFFSTKAGFLRICVCLSHIFRHIPEKKTAGGGLFVSL